MESIPVCKPLLPTADRLRLYLERIDMARYYSNGGPLLHEFEARLASHFGVADDKVVTSANGTLALVQTLNSFDIVSGSLCVMPSWTFVATPAAAIAAGLTPYFIDIHGKDWAIHPEEVMPLLAHHKVGAVIPVAPFGAPLDIAAWQRFREATGIPVIIDAASGFDAFGAAMRSEDVTLPVMISLHATKTLGIGEGAVMVTNDAGLARRIRMHGGFGFFGSREAQVPGFNAKLSEYAAAVGLAALDDWPHKREAWKKLSNQFEKEVKRHAGITCAPGFNQGWISSYGVIEAQSPAMAEAIRSAFARRHIGEIAWWGEGCHRHAGYKECPRSPLKNTDHLAGRVLGLPFWLGLPQADLTRIFECLSETAAGMQLKKMYG